MKKLLSVVLVLAVLFSFASCAKKEEAPVVKADGKVFTIYCWNEEFQSRFRDYFEKAGLIPAGVTVNWVVTPNENNAYQNKLDEALLAQDKAAPDDKIDLFLIEADYALKYVDSPYALDVKADIGLTDSDLAGQYQYTKDIVTDKNGKQRGTTWQATPGLYAYRRSIAKEVLGTDDPVKVQEALSDWNKFNEVAAKMKAAGYFMLSGYDDSFRTFSNNLTQPWVDSSDKIHISDSMFEWVDQTKEFTDKGYNEKTSLWNTQWQAGQGPAGKVFGYFYSTWGINFTLLGNSLAVPEKEGGKQEVGNGIFGDWAVCEGPAPYYWGGTWLCGAKGSDNIDLVRSVMKTLTCDPVVMKKITVDTQDYTNTVAGMKEFASSDFKSAFLGGQNHIALFAKAAEKIDMSNICPYDQGMTEEFQKAFKDYFDGVVATKEIALENFYKAILEKYPNLKR